LSRKFPEGTYIPSRRERDRDTLRFRAIDKLRMDSTIVCKDPARNRRGQENPLEGSEFEKLRRRNAS
jgi:hypothetical protein